MIDLSDTQIKTIGTKYRTLYRASCDQCGVDRGYLAKQNAKRPLCKQCARLGALSEESRRKMSEAKIGKTPHNKGKTGVSEETRKKMSNAKIGKSPSNKGKSCPEEVKVKISMSVRGIDTFESFADRGKRQKEERTDKTKQVRTLCYQRDDHTCQSCNKRGGNLNAHHLNSWKFFPEQRYSIDNLITLCATCHKKFHKENGNGITEPNTAEQFYSWLGRD